MAIRRIQSRTETYQLGHLKLYRDDLETIAKALAEAGELRITCGPWEMTDPTDFTDSSELPELLPDLVMEAQRSVTAGQRTSVETPISVVLTSQQASVKLTEPDTLTLGVLSRIRQVTDLGRRWPGMMIAQFLVAVLTPFAWAWSRPSPPLRDSSAIVINAYRASRPSFWQRTRDDWAVGTVMLLLGLILGGVVGYYVNTIT